MVNIFAMLAPIEIDCALLQCIPWDDVRNQYVELCDMVSNGSVTDMYDENAYGARIFCIDGGCILETVLGDPDKWYLWAGKNLEQSIHACEIMRHRLVGSDLDFINFNFWSHSGSIRTHVDGHTDSEQADGHCNLNFIVSSSDHDSFVYCESDQNTIVGNSKTGTLWLLDNNIRHGVKNTGRREVFQLRFHNTYAQVFTWLTNHRDFLSLP